MVGCPLGRIVDLLQERLWQDFVLSSLLKLGCKAITMPDMEVNKFSRCGICYFASSQKYFLISDKAKTKRL